MLLPGKDIAEAILKEVSSAIHSMDRPPHLAVIIAGNDPASEIYVNIKQKTLKKVGILTTIHRFPHDVLPSDLETCILRLNENSTIDGILIQLPLPPHLPFLDIIELIAPHKDVDGLTPYNMGKLLLGPPAAPYYIPCTPLGIATLLEKGQIPTQGKHVVIIGRGRLVGRPLASLLLQPRYGSTITIVHKQSIDIEQLTLQADILIAACGVPHFVQPSMVKPHAVVIDVGIHKTHHGIIGDVSEAVYPIVSAITPVPGGVGPMTVAMLAYNMHQSLSLR